MGDFSVFSKRLKELRSKEHMTQRKFAELVGCTAATLSAYENGTKSPSLEIVKNIAEKCGVSIDWLCGLDSKSSMKTYSDFLNELVKLEEFSPIKITETDGVNAIRFQDHIVQDFLSDWGRMLDLYHKGTIDSGLYNLWIDDKIKNYSGFYLYDPSAEDYFYELKELERARNEP